MISLTPIRTGVNDLSNGISGGHVFNLYQVKACGIYLYFKQSTNRALACVHEGQGGSESTTLLFMNTGIVDVEATLRLCNRTIVERMRRAKERRKYAYKISHPW
jgi:hypothetical protein